MSHIYAFKSFRAASRLGNFNKTSVDHFTRQKEGARKGRMSSDILEEIFKDVFREQQLIKVRVEKRKGRREVTLVEGLDPKSVDLRDLATKLKSKLACGGTAKNGRIELQGDHRFKVKEILTELGFDPSSILIE